MKYINSINCNNSSNCHRLSLENKSLILLQRFTKRDEQNSTGIKEFTQSKGFVLPYSPQTLITVIIKINTPEFKILTTQKKKSLWLQLRKQLYWSCEITDKAPSLCRVLKSTSILIIQINEASFRYNKESYIQCSICFLNSTNMEIINWNHISEHLKTLTFNLQQYLPRNASHKLSNIYINVTRTDLLIKDENIERVFITNISMINSPKETHKSKLICKFICGWGPECLENLKQVCDGESNCLQGEDEDDRLCSVFRLETSSFKKDFQQDTIDGKVMDHRVMTNFYSYLFVIICVIIFLIMIALFVFFICRSRNFDKYIHNNTSKLQIITTSTQDSDTTCSTCQNKSRMNFSKRSHSRQHLRKLDDLAYCTDSEPVTVVGREISGGKTKFYANVKGNRSFQDSRARYKGVYNFKSTEVTDTADWLNLFFHISSEARHKSLASHPPPNVNNNNGKPFVCSHNLPTTTSTCVFPVMI